MGPVESDRDLVRTLWTISRGREDSETKQQGVTLMNFQCHIQ